jgi:phosphoglucosamine mutase
MSNLGLKKFAEANGFNLVTTKVGDRYVLENMLANEYNFGGEQSGHIIMLDYNPTGDGILTSLMLLKTLLSRKEKLSEAKKIITIYPQVLINAKVSSEKKYDYEKDEEISKAILELEREFQDNGRVLIRPSGTEPKVRVMIEGQDIEYITKRANELAQLIEKKLK